MNKFRNEVQHDLNDNTYKLRGTFDVLVKLETELGMSVPMMVESLATVGLTLSQSAAILKYGLIGSGSNKEIEVIKEDIMEGGVTRAAYVCSEFLSSVLWGGNAQAKKKIAMKKMNQKA